MRFPEGLLIAPTPFGAKLTAEAVATAIGRGVSAAGMVADLCPVAAPDDLDGDFDRRMRDALAVVTGERRLDQSSLAGKLISEVATRARQAGVPCHAIVGRRRLDSFGARVLDLQAILEASTLDELEAAGRRLAELIAAGSAGRGV
ncbi:MAG TPA: glycerate kinase [Solirubrobacteraceae bacterium]|nr:glycerate kinase [Solirubrobacteraceae bacterium]